MVGGYHERMLARAHELFYREGTQSVPITAAPGLPIHWPGSVVRNMRDEDGLDITPISEGNNLDVLPASLNAADLDEVDGTALLGTLAALLGKASEQHCQSNFQMSQHIKNSQSNSPGKTAIQSDENVCARCRHHRSAHPASVKNKNNQSQHLADWSGCSLRDQCADCC